MEIKLFGRSLFEVNKLKGAAVLSDSMSQVKKSKYLPDFHQGFDQGTSMWGNSFISLTEATSIVKVEAEPVKVEKEKKKFSPKEVYNLQMLHDKAFKLKADPTYVDEQIALFKDKLALITSEEYDTTRGTREIGSIVTRLENRKKYAENREFYEQFPYTTSGRIENVLKKHDYLKLGQVAQFLADMPREASDTMKAYNKATAKVCDLQAVFYIIADKKDFEKTTKRRDPILLAQSPFGHFWQILGAWDKEMLLVDEL